MSLVSRICLLLLLGVLLSGCTTTTSKPDLSDEQLHRASELNAELGVRYMQQGNYDWAMTKLQKSIEQNEDNARAHHYLAELYRRVGKPKDAEKHFQAAMDLSPDDPALLNNYGIFLCDRNKYEQALRYFNKALNDPVYPGKAGIYENMGQCELQRGNLYRAEEYLLKALHLNPKLPQANLDMAQLTFDKQLYTQSRNYLNNYLAQANHNAQSLWLGILLERRTGNRNRVASYAILLKGKFPDSKEAKLLRKLEAKGQL